MADPVERPYEVRSGMEILEALDLASHRVEAAAAELGKLSQQFGEGYLDQETGELKMGIGLEYETKLGDEKAHLYQSAIEEEKRPPPADIRAAVAEKAIQVKYPALWAEYHTTVTRIKALQAWISNQKAIISANQSIRKGESP